MGQRSRQSKQCVRGHHTLPKHNPSNSPSKSPTNNPFISLPVLQLSLHLHALGSRMVLIQPPPPCPPRHISLPWPAFHILATNTLHLRYSPNDPQWSPTLADLAIDIPCESRCMGLVREGGCKNGEYRGVLMHCHDFRSPSGDSCPAYCRRDGA